MLVCIPAKHALHNPHVLIRGVPHSTSDCQPNVGVKGSQKGGCTWNGSTLLRAGHGAGEPMIIKKAVCMHEEDYGTLWKHTEYRTGHSEVRRSRRLVLSFISTIANYEYGFYWYFYQVSSHPQPASAWNKSLV